MSTTLEQVHAWIIELLAAVAPIYPHDHHHPEDADDLVQMCIERALQRYEQWRLESRFEGAAASMGQVMR